MVIPFARSYWVVPGRLLAGYIPASRDPETQRNNLAGLLKVGIRAVVNLTEPGECNSAGVALPDYSEEWETLAGEVPVDYHGLGFNDGTAPDDELMERILGTIDRSLDQGRPVYVHCWGGRGRTGTVVGCWLARHGMAGEFALEMVQYLRRSDPKAAEASPETAEQIAMVRRWRSLTADLIKIS
jgi:hypothetical protein